MVIYVVIETGPARVVSAWHDKEMADADADERLNRWRLTNGEGAYKRFDVQETDVRGYGDDP